MNVFFDRNLVVGDFDPLNWSVRWANQSWEAGNPNVNPGSPTLVAFTIANPVPDPGLDGVSYSPPPFDIISDTARRIPANAFADFPLHL